MQATAARMPRAEAINGRIAVREQMRLSLPRFPSGVDVVLVVGRRRLVAHRTVEDRYRERLARLQPWGVTIARREVRSLFDASGTVLRAARLANRDQEWLTQMEKHGGIMVSIDGMQPDPGNETVDRVRDAALRAGSGG